MFTACPNCKLHLAVTAVDLRVGQGYVRCGRCDKVFNALLSLAEDVDRDKPAGVATGTTTVPALEEEQQADALLQMPPSAATTSPPQFSPPSQFETEVIVDLGPELMPEFEPHPAPAEPDPSLPSEPVEFTPEPDDFTAPDEWSRITPIHSAQLPDMEVVENLATGTFETIVLEGDGFLQTEELVDEEEVDAQILQISNQIDADELSGARQRLVDVPDVEVHEVTAEEVILGDGPTDELDADQAVGNAPRAHWGWGMAAGLLVLLLLGQYVNHARQALVARTWAEGPLRAIYGLFGVNLEPKWDLKAYDLRPLGDAQLGATAKIVLHATVQNHATAAQPPPMIRVTLLDRFGNTLTTTAVAPQDYLKGSAPVRMDPDQRLDAELVLDDANKQAAGFELDVCLPDAARQLHCSTDP